MVNVVKEALKTLPIYFIIFSAHGLFMWGMFNPYHQAFKSEEDAIKDKFDFENTDAAESKDGLFHRLFWKILAADPNQGGVQLKKFTDAANNGTEREASPSHEFSHVAILIAWAGYQIVIAMIMINLLIAIMNDTFTDIRKNADTNWKYSRSYYQVTL